MRRLALLAAVLAVPAFADDECLVPDDAFKPQIDAKKLPMGARVKDQGRKERVYRETIAYPDGTNVTVQVSGCDHFMLSLEIRSKKLVTAKLRGPAAVALMTKTLEALPMLKDAAFRPSIFLGALKLLKAPPTRFPFPIDCQKYGSCELQMETTGEPALLAVFDSPL